MDIKRTWTVAGTTLAAGGFVTALALGGAPTLNDMQPSPQVQMAGVQVPGDGPLLAAGDDSPESVDSPTESPVDSTDSPYDSPDDRSDLSPETPDSPDDSPLDSPDSPDSPDESIDTP